MTFPFFETVAEVKSHYRKLALENHPDHGGSEEAMKAVNNAYEEALRRLDGKTFQKDNGEGTYTYKYNDETEKDIMDIIDRLLRLKMEGVNIILMNLYVWVDGNTKPYKDQLGKKEGGLGLNWSKHRAKWYWKPVWCKSRRSPHGFETLAAKYNATFMSDKDRRQPDEEPERNRLTA